jgi:signal transduction histidine kinase
MRRAQLSVRVALAVSLLALLVLVAAGVTAGYLVEAHRQRTERDHRRAAAVAYVKGSVTRAKSTRWQPALAEQLDALRLSAQLTMISPGGKRAIYASKGLVATTTSNRPVASYTFPLADGSASALALDLYAQPLDGTRRLLVALASGLAALLAGGALLIWAASRWLVAPLRRLNTRVDAIAGGDPIETRATSPIREVENVATAVAGMAARLADTAEHDAQLEAERRLLVSSIAHDLRTPLFSLRGYLDAIATGIGNPGERLDRARAKAQQIDRLVTDLFDYATADIEKRPRLQTTDLAEAVTDATAAFEFAADQRAIKLRVTVLTTASVRMDRDAFERALANVLDNALRHTPGGGAVEVTCGEDEAGAFVCVVDDGPGIASDLLPHVFEPMVRADGARNPRTGGAGLGLTIAARLLRNQDGSIDAANAPERGAILTLRFPRTVAQPSPGKHPEQTKSSP